MITARLCRCGTRVRGSNRCPACTPTTAQRGYDYAWEKLRARILEEEPLCRSCDELGRAVPAHHVHHIEPVDECRSLRLEPSNLMPLCAPCHEAEHAQ